MGNSKIFRFGLNQENYKKSGIYQIRNTVNGKFYIGSAGICMERILSDFEFDIDIITSKSNSKSRKLWCSRRVV